ncbi:MAG: hypothetical protein Q8942_03670 [Bacillota bacterium]|nr:hypothetical protein [Bacillota bacterium]
MEQTSSQVVSSNSSVLNSSILSATTLLASPSNSKKVEGIKVPLVGKIPVVISEADVQVYVDATIQLEEPALEITRVKKNIFLTRSQLILTDDKKSSKLILSGFVRNCVEYSTARHVGNTSVSGRIRFTVVNIPFKCFTKIDFLTDPVSAVNPQIFTSSARSSDGMGSDQFALSITNSEILNEKIYCELIESKVRQVDIKRDIEELTSRNGRNLNEHTFRSFLESMVIELKLRVLQNQSVYISQLGDTGKAQGGNGNSNNNSNGNNSSNGNNGNDGGKRNDGNGSKEGSSNEKNSEDKKGNSGDDKKGGKDSDKKNEDRNDKKDNKDDNKKDGDKKDGGKKDDGKDDGKDNKKAKESDSERESNKNLENEENKSKDNKDAVSSSEEKKE